MPVLSERKDQELTIITKARDLVDETMSRTKKFDKRLRFTLSNRIDEKALVVIRQHLAERGLELNQKTNIFPLRNGLDFLGFHTYIDDAGRVIRKVRKSSRDRMKRKLRKYAALYQRGEIDREKIAESYTSWRAHALHGDCRQLVAKYDQQFLSIFERRPEHVQEDQHSGREC